MATPSKTRRNRTKILDHNSTGRKFFPPLARKHSTPARKLGTAPKTILIVEDHPLLLKLVAEILTHAHFKVLSASGPKEALGIVSTYKGTIDLLVSDIMMPEMTGPDLAKLLIEQRPKLRIILMSAFPDGAMLVLNYGWHFIQKPFLTEALVASVKAVLKGKNRAQDTDHFDTRK
jgi:DNA-binding response OmpR family regulator